MFRPLFSTKFSPLAWYNTVKRTVYVKRILIMRLFLQQIKKKRGISPCKSSEHREENKTESRRFLFAPRRRLTSVQRTSARCCCRGFGMEKRRYGERRPKAESNRLCCGGMPCIWRGLFSAFSSRITAFIEPSANTCDSILRLVHGTEKHSFSITPISRHNTELLLSFPLSFSMSIIPRFANIYIYRHRNGEFYGVLHFFL